MPTNQTPPPLDPKEALTHLKTMIRMASETDDFDLVRKLLGEMRRVVDKPLPRRRRSDRHGD